MLEDDGDDRHITATFFAEHHSNIGLHFLSEPEEMLPYLEQCCNDETLLPSLIILDKYMPKGGSMAVLDDIKQHPVCKQIPVVVVSGSDLNEDIEESYRLGANSYIVKPLRNEHAMKKISAFVTYWFEVAELPQLPARYEMM